jgi:hypothetical protein
MALDVISFVIGWPAFGDILKSQYWTASFRDENGWPRSPGEGDGRFAGDLEVLDETYSRCLNVCT